MLGPEDVVLDVGGWADPFDRADWVIDLMPYDTRGLYERAGWVPPRRGVERFTAETWIQRDLCDREPFPFADRQIDFVICSQTLEDLRDPLWVCGELIRVAKAGYIEVPSRLEEQSWGVNGAFVGWSHHRWLIDVAGGAVEFTVKLHALHSRPEWYFPAGFWNRLSEEDRVQALWWEDGFGYRERPIMDDRDADEYLRPFVARELAARRLPAPSPLGFLRGRIAGRLQQKRAVTDAPARQDDQL
jgi:hypothetical protein